MNKSKSAPLSTTLRLFLALSLLFSACFLTPNAVRPAFAADSIKIAGTSIVEGNHYISDPNGGLKPSEGSSENYLTYSVGQNGENVITIKGDMNITVPEDKVFVFQPVTIETTGHLTIIGSTEFSLVNGTLTIGSEMNRAGSVTIKNSTSSSSPVLGGAVKIYATKDVSISGNTTSSVIGGACTIDTTGDVTLENTNTGSYSNVLYGESTINTTGDVEITANTKNAVVKEKLNIGTADKRAKSVTIKNENTDTSNPARTALIDSRAEIYATGSVTVTGNTSDTIFSDACIIDTSGDVTLRNTAGKVCSGGAIIDTTGKVEITGATGVRNFINIALAIGKNKIPSSVEIKNTNDSVSSSANLIDGPAEIHATGSVTVTGNTSGAIFDTCRINTTGDVTLGNTNTGFHGNVLYGESTINTTGNVSITGNTYDSIVNDALTIGSETNHAGSVTIQNSTSSSNPVLYGAVKIYATKDVSISGNTTSSVIDGVCLIDTSGDVTLENTTGKVCSSTVTIDTTGDVKIIGDTGAYYSLINGALTIGRTKTPSSVEIKNTGDSVSIANLIEGAAKVTSAGNVTVTGSTSYSIFRGACTINTSGNVTLRNTAGKVCRSRAKIYATGNVTVTGNTSDAIFYDTCQIDTFGDVTLENTTGNVSITGNTYSSIVGSDLTIGSETHRAGSVTIKNSTSSSKPVLYGAVKIYATKDVSISGNTTNSVIGGACIINTSGDVKIIDDTSAYYSLIDGDLTIGSSNVPAKSVEITNAFTPNDEDSSSLYVVHGSAAIYATGDVSITGRSSDHDSLVGGTFTIGSDTVHAASITLTNKDAKALNKEPTIFGLYDMKAGDSADTASPVENPTEEDYKKAYVQLTAHTHTHDFTGEWKYDSTGHWHECPADGTLSDKQPHTFGDWTISGDKRTHTCECGYSETETVAAPVTPDVDVPMPALNGWKVLPQGTVYYKNSVKLKGWQTLDGTTYYFDAKGYLQTGWLHLEDNWYYLDSTGARQTGWVKVKNTWYYLDSDGVMLSATWLEDNGKWYYLAPSGAMYNNQWRCTKGVWYYLLGNGEMAKNRWIEDKGDWYYFGSDGAMLVSTTAPDGSKLGADGKWIG